MDKQRLILTIVGIILFVALMIYLHIEGFAQFSSYQSFNKEKRNSSSLCDPCFDPECKTEYSPSQSECDNRRKAVYSMVAPLLETTPTPTTTASKAAAAAESTPASVNTVTMSANDFYDFMKPQIVKTVRDSMASVAPSASITTKPTGVVTTPAPTVSLASSASVPLQPTQLPNPMPAAFGQTPTPHATFAGRQGEDYSGCKPFNKDEYIRKDSIPCWGCSIAAPY